ncbi:iron ABC transporter permease [Bacillaceae bacterium SIJ1]|uniref:iron ABC transporter permease n=1 Tax=Litoribacterium kuwaitense TaxID=1398745 RepID=UPI0013EC2EA3|nr:iron ABC transporter permease [Litoribacterium kuwaitense]NGP46403.1 iron ABC transporter permease [Litoribacterium kuwaitense]
MLHRKRMTVLSLGCIGLFLVLASVHLSQGQSSPGYVSFWQQFMHDEQQWNFLLYQRLPRFVIGCLAGAALAIAGMIMQTITKNPLASASTLGIHSGAYFFVVATTIFMPKMSGAFPLLVTFSGGLVAALLVWVLVGKALDPVRVALTGMIVSMLFASLTGALQLFFANEVSGLFLWGSGTLLQLDWSGVQFAWPWVLIFIGCALLISRKLDVLLLDEATAIGLGENVGRNKLLGWFVAIFLVAVTVAVVGPIGFIGIIAPHIVRLIGFRKHFTMIIANMIIGAMLLIGADILVRLVSQTSELPVGAMTALIGGPWLVYLAIQMGTRRKGATSSATLGGHDFFRRKGVAIIVAAFIAGATVFVSLLFGGTSFTPVSQIFTDIAHNLYVWEFRVPRVLVSFLVGMIMAAGGMIFQAILRNPLADASVLGVTSGAGMMAMILLIVFPSVPFYFVPFGAIFGSLLAMAIILFITYRSGFQPVMLVLIGVCISAMFSSIIQVLIVKAKLHVTQALTWISGSTYGSNWEEVMAALVTIAIFFPVIFYFTRTLDIFAFNDEAAIGLGVPTVKVRFAMVIIGVVLAGISAAIVGTIGFIGLLAPHAARRMVGSKHQFIFPISVLLGGILLTIADFLGRYLLAPNDIPSGLMVSLVGAPYLLYLLKKAGRVSVT